MLEKYTGKAKLPLISPQEKVKRGELEVVSVGLDAIETSLLFLKLANEQQKDIVYLVGGQATGKSVEARLLVNIARSLPKTFLQDSTLFTQNTDAYFNKDEILTRSIRECEEKIPQPSPPPMEGRISAEHFSEDNVNDKDRPFRRRIYEKKEKNAALQAKKFGLFLEYIEKLSGKKSDNKKQQELLPFYDSSTGSPLLRLQERIGRMVYHPVDVVIAEGIIGALFIEIPEGNRKDRKRQERLQNKTLSIYFQSPADLLTREDAITTIVALREKREQGGNSRSSHDTIYEQVIERIDLEHAAYTIQNSEVCDLYVVPHVESNERTFDVYRRIKK